jgi:ABC-type transport system involved in cytochrome bd biosynthesis fused ATPase/permease subunit
LTSPKCHQAVKKPQQINGNLGLVNFPGSPTFPMHLKHPAKGHWCGDQQWRVMMQTSISIKGLSKTFKGSRALNGINVEIAAWEFVALIGASGSGITTLLRHISGFIAGDQGSSSHVAISGRSVQRNGRIARTP